MTTLDYLEQLQQDREDLVDNLETKGITGLTGDETFTQLVAKVLNIPSGSGELDWSAIGLEQPPKSVSDAYSYAKSIYDNWENVSGLTNKFAGDTNIVYMPLVNTSNATAMNNMFMSCSNLTDVPLLNTSNCTFFNSMFNGCTNLKNVSLLDTSSLNNDYSFFAMFQNCPNLTTQSLDNILQMCINATSYEGTKTLARLGFSKTYYSSSTIQALPHYQDFIDAGWTIGY